MIITKLRGAGEGELDKVTTGVKTHRRKQEKYVEGCKRKPRETDRTQGRCQPTALQGQRRRDTTTRNNARLERRAGEGGSEGFEPTT